VVSKDINVLQPERYYVRIKYISIVCARNKGLRDIKRSQMNTVKLRSQGIIITVQFIRKINLLALL
jgi:hypothetical protein